MDIITNVATIITIISVVANVVQQKERGHPLKGLCQGTFFPIQGERLSFSPCKGQHYDFSPCYCDFQPLFPHPIFQDCRVSNIFTAPVTHQDQDRETKTYASRPLSASADPENLRFHTVSNH